MKKISLTNIFIAIILLITTTAGCSNSTKPREGSIVAYGDSRTNQKVHEKIISLISDIKPEAIIHTGDMVYNGYSTEDWNSFNLVTQSIRSITPFFPAIGNHENDSYLFYENFKNLPLSSSQNVWYTVKIDNIDFIFLDSNKEISTDSKQYIWLINTLEKLKDSKFIVLVFHHPIFDAGLHQPDEKDIANYILPLIREYGITLVINGHDHNYQRFLYDNTFHIITGGGGAPLYSKHRDSKYLQKFYKKYHFCTINIINQIMYVEVFDDNLTLLDMFTILPRN